MTDIFYLLIHLFLVHLTISSVTPEYIVRNGWMTVKNELEGM
jgi:hypothetical protein